MDDIRVVELFAGVGGFRLGLETASERFKVIWANQWEPYQNEQFAFSCYTRHFGTSLSHICADIAKVKENVPEHDLLVGGFPCQDYSILKKDAKGIEGTKGRLWWEIDAILEKRRPKYVILENVDRLIRSPARQIGRDFSIILRCFYEKGYAVEWRVVNAADYGCAQRRRRTFIVAYHNTTAFYRRFAEDVCRQWLKTMHRYVVTDGIMAQAFPVQSFRKEYFDQWIDEMSFSSMQDVTERQRARLYDAGIMINGRIYSLEVVPQCIPPIQLKDILERGIVNERYFLKENELPQWIYKKGAKREIRKRADGSEYVFTEGAMAFPDPLDKPSRTLVTSETKISRTSHVVQDLLTGRLRTLTPIECERLNGFPDDWTAGMPDKMRYFCMGNALVVPMVTKIGNIIYKLNIR